MTAITETQVRKLASAGDITAYEILEDELGWWHLRIHTKAKDSPMLMISARNSVRRWSDLDRLIKTIKSFDPRSAQLVLTPFFPENEETKEANSK